MCTRIFWTDNGQAAVVARTLDTSLPSRARAVWSPPGQTRGGDGCLAWTSRFGNLVVRDYMDSAVEGLNDAGLGAHALMDTEASYPPAGDGPLLRTLDWLQYVLDSFATVAEAVAGHRDLGFQPEALLVDSPDGPFERLIGMHLVIDDASGDTALFEFVDEALVIRHDRNIHVVANAPSLPEQMANLARYAPFGGDLPQPGGIVSLDRFVRASYALHHLPRPETLEQTIAYASQAVAVAAKSPGIPYPDGTDYPTRWISAADLTHKTLYFWDRELPAAVWIRVDGLTGSDVVRLLPLHDPELAGDVTDLLQPLPPG